MVDSPLVAMRVIFREFPSKCSEHTDCPSWPPSSPGGRALYTAGGAQGLGVKTRWALDLSLRASP